VKENCDPPRRATARPPRWTKKRSAREAILWAGLRSGSPSIIFAVFTGNCGLCRDGVESGDHVWI
jgi:hypothetical protein